jgi:D-alanyl-D-alanine endopeptidase (penicillin-binding protein 7)
MRKKEGKKEREKVRTIGTFFLSFILSIFLCSATPARASLPEAGESAKAQLKAIYEQRSDLQKLFDGDDWTAAPSEKTAGMKTLEDWASQYGYVEYPDELLWYAPAAEEPLPPPRALADVDSALAPAKKDGARFDFDSLSAEAVMVVDAASRETLLANRSRAPHSMASLTKLMTAMVVLDRRVPMTRTMILAKKDEVGGARLRVAVGTRLTVRDLFYATLVGSANNAANALARSTNLDADTFIGKMNGKAEELGLRGTKFVDTSGMDARNVSTPEDTAALAIEAFGKYEIKKATTTAKYSLLAQRAVHQFNNTNALLTDDKNGLIVLGGKTGYLPEAGWNLAVKMMDARHKPLIVVVFGSENKDRSFKDAEVAARWAWDNYKWGGK